MQKGGFPGACGAFVGEIVLDEENRVTSPSLVKTCDSLSTWYVFDKDSPPNPERGGVENGTHKVVMTLFKTKKNENKRERTNRESFTSGPMDQRCSVWSTAWTPEDTPDLIALG